MVEVTSLLLAMLSGLATGMALFLAAVGLTLVFGVLDVLNFAHGSLYMLGAYSMYFLVRGEGPIPVEINFWIAVVIAAVFVAVFGAFLERVFIRPIYDVDHVFQLLLTFALVLVIDNGVRILWGTDYRSVDVPGALDFTVPIFGRGFPAYELFLITAGAVSAVGMWLMFERTQIGKIVRAASEDRDMANALGINVPAVFTLVFLFGSALAGLGGALAAPLQSVIPSMGETIIIEAFIIVVIGGLGSFTGAFIGAILIGLVESIAFVFIPNFEPVIPFILLAAVIVVRPAGLFGEVKT